MLFQDFMAFVPGVTQANENTGSVQDFILLFFWWESRELRGRGSPRFPSVAPVVKNFSSNFLRAVITYWSLESISRVAFSILSNIHDVAFPGK